MSRPLASCPSCGAPVEFHWAGAVQAVCRYCSSILVRHDLDLELVGKVAARLPTSSPVQIGTRGHWRDRGFTVTGRIAYAYERGGWNEWHLLLDDGGSAWLSDAQAEYALSVLSPAPPDLPPPERLRVGDALAQGAERYTVTALTRARYVGVEGELPFEYWDKSEVLFADLRTGRGGFATLDYSESPPLLFTGEVLDFEALRLTGLREEEAGPAAEAATLNCPHCGGRVEIHAAGQTVSVACSSCGSVLDATSPGLRVLQRFDRRVGVEPLIPMGRQGRWHGAEYRVIGFQVRVVRVEGEAFRWGEYLLFNRERGFRYLTEYDGHWNDVIPLHVLPQEWSRDGRPAASVHGTTFRHFQTAVAETSFALGEFPWEVRVGDRAETHDYVAPPRLLSKESTGAETTWSLGEYTPGARIWEAFSLPGSPPEARGVFANQPSPHAGRVRGMWEAFAVLMLLFVGLCVWRATGGQNVLRETHAYTPGPVGSGGVVTAPFTLRGRPSRLEVAVGTNLENGVASFHFSLLNQETGRVTEFGRNLSYFSGVEDGERWSEGSARASLRLPSVPPGRYVLRVDPQAGVPLEYWVRVRRDVASLAFFGIALLLLLAPPVFASLQHGSYETRRWAESDYAGGGGDDDD